MPEPLPAMPSAPQGGMVKVFDQNGQPGTIPVSQLPDAQAQGYVVDDKPTEAPLSWDTIKAGGRGALTGLTAGLATPIEKWGENTFGPLLGIQGAGDRYAAESKRLETEHPTASAVGEGVGIVGGTALGSSLIGTGGRVAGVAGRGLGLLGEAGEGAAAGFRGLVGEGARGALGRAAVAGGELAVRGATETAIYNGIKEISEESLGKPELSAEKIWAAAADGAVDGALFGGVLGAGGSLVKSGAKGLVGIAQDVASKNAGSLEKLANEQRWRALDPTLKFTKEANARIPGGTEAAGEVLGRYNITGNTIEEAIRGGGVEEIAGKLDTAVEQVGQKIGAITDSSTATVPVGHIADALNEVIAPLRREAGRESVVKSLETYGESLMSKFLPEGTEAGGVAAARETPITIQDALFQRKALDRMVYDESKALDPAVRVKFLRDFRSKFENVIVDAFDEAATAAGNPAAKSELLGLKRDYQALSLAQEAAEHAVSRTTTNRSISLTDYITGGIGSSIGSAVGGYVGDEYGAAVGGVLGGIAGARVNKFGRSRGNAIAAAAADRLAAFGGKTRLTAKIADEASALSALEREAAAADGVAAKPSAEAEAPIAQAENRPIPEATAGPVPEAPTGPMPKGADRSTELTFSKEWHPNALEEMGAKTTTSHEDLSKGIKEIFGDKIPTADAWHRVWQLPEGYTAHFDNVELFRSPPREGNLPQLSLEMKISDPNGEMVGDLFRSFRRDDAGKLIVDHDYMTLDPSVQGKGIASAMTKSSLKAYKDMGVDRIDVHAALSAGPYTWARQGFQWNKEEADDMAWKIRDYARRKFIDQAQGEKLAKTAYEGPRAVSEMTVNGENIGKDFLLQSGGWHGYKDVEALAAQREAMRSAQDAEKAAYLQKAAEFERAQAAIKKVDAQLDRSAAGLVEGPGTHPYREPASKKPLKERFEEAQANVDLIQERQARIIDRASVQQASMPKISTALSTGALRAAMFLQSSSPSSLNTQPILGRELPVRTSVAAMKEFVDKYDATNDPMATFRKFERGRITTVEARTLQQVSPEMFAELQERCMKTVVDRQAAGKPLPFDARQRMHLLLGIQTDPSQNSKIMKALQANLASPTGNPDEPGVGGAPAGGSSRPVQMPATERTYERLEEG